LHAEFSELFTTLFTKLVEDESIAVGLGESFEPLITQNGYDAALEQLSGGEKTAVALSYRLGLYKVISEFVTTIATRDLLILDEPTDGFSTEQLHRVRDVLRELGCRQILLVSHEQQMEGACDHVIRITKRLHRSVADAAS
jgi:exonuclease SbcC